jgi:hypothetical protein
MRQQTYLSEAEKDDGSVPLKLLKDARISLDKRRGDWTFHSPHKLNGKVMLTATSPSAYQLQTVPRTHCAPKTGSWTQQAQQHTMVACLYTEPTGTTADLKSVKWSRDDGNAPRR